MYDKKNGVLEIARLFVLQVYEDRHNFSPDCRASSCAPTFTFTQTTE